MGNDDLQMLDFGSGEEEERVHEWEDGLPSTDDLPPLSHNLISPQLASAFRITPEPCRSMIDVDRATHTTLSMIRKSSSSLLTPPFSNKGDPQVVQADEPEQELMMISTRGDGSRKSNDDDGEDDDDDNLSSRNNNNAKRARLVWTPQLHKRFVDVVGHLGIKNAVPKTIMQLMNVEGLTRENVASHLQKYRLYLKRMQGLSNEGPSTSDPLFATTPVPPQSLLHESSNVPLHPMRYPGGLNTNMPGIGNMVHGHHGHSSGGGATHHGFEANYYSMYRGEQQRDWSANMFNPILAYPYVNQNDK